ncbi:glycosyltransferase family 1 protein [Psychrobacter sp. FDAARGOS_221]|nr:glycosyltransferase family 1 protein [Psychrobacter sp. FDAARGOS_221]PNK61969.1 glycosyltransferase family 1 protein [Psychrobacter sp. FDAARGOS_221]
MFFTKNTTSTKKATSDTSNFHSAKSQSFEPNHSVVQPTDMPTLHVLLVTETWLPDMNGVAMSLQRIMKQMAEMGHQVSLVRPKPKMSGNDKYKLSVQQLVEQNSFIANDIQVKGMSIPKYASLQFGLPSYPTFIKTLKRIRPDIVHIATEGPLGLAALLAAKRLGISATTGYHTQFHDFSKHFGLGVLAEPIMTYFKWLHNSSKATCVPSRKTYNDLDQLGFKRLYEVGRGVDLVQFNPKHRSNVLRTKWGANKDDTVLVMVSRLSPEKGIDLVIKSFQALKQSQPQRALKLVIVGDGPDKPRLEALAKNNKADIHFAGAQTGLDLSEHYASGDAFVFASQVETFGNVVIEAMASGLPVYAFDDAAAGMLVGSNQTAEVDNHPIKDNPSIKQSDKGALAALGNEQAFINMVANLPEQARLHQQGQLATASVAQFSWQRPAKQMLEMFYNAIGKKG